MGLGGCCGLIKYLVVIVNALFWVSVFQLLHGDKELYTREKCFVATKHEKHEKISKGAGRSLVQNSNAQDFSPWKLIYLCFSCELPTVNEAFDKMCSQTRRKDAKLRVKYFLALKRCI